jgi:hypothetical protein
VCVEDEPGVAGCSKASSSRPSSRAWARGCLQVAVTNSVNYARVGMMEAGPNDLCRLPPSMAKTPHLTLMMSTRRKIGVGEKGVKLGPG